MHKLLEDISNICKRASRGPDEPIIKWIAHEGAPVGRAHWTAHGRIGSERKAKADALLYDSAHKHYAVIVEQLAKAIDSLQYAAGPTRDVKTSMLLNSLDEIRKALDKAMEE